MPELVPNDTTVAAVAALVSVTVPVAAAGAVTTVGEIVSELRAGTGGGVTLNVACDLSEP